jgi:hypothetical protein
MKKAKPGRRGALAVLALCALLLIGIFVLLGGRRSDVYLEDYTLTENGQTMVLQTSVAGSAGYVRKMYFKEEAGGLYLTFYSTFGINSRLGAKDTFPIELPQDCRAIYFNRPEGAFECVLEKDPATGVWARPGK